METLKWTVLPLLLSSDGRGKELQCLALAWTPYRRFWVKLQKWLVGQLFDSLNWEKTLASSCMPAVMDLVDIRDQMTGLADKEYVLTVNPLVSVELVIDHLVQVDAFHTGVQSSFPLRFCNGVEGCIGQWRWSDSCMYSKVTHICQPSPRVNAHGMYLLDIGESDGSEIPPTSDIVNMALELRTGFGCSFVCRLILHRAQVLLCVFNVSDIHRSDHISHFLVVARDATNCSIFESRPFFIRAFNCYLLDSSVNMVLYCSKTWVALLCSHWFASRSQIPELLLWPKTTSVK